MFIYSSSYHFSSYHSSLKKFISQYELLVLSLLVKEVHIRSKEVRKANVFVSHAWRYQFLEVIDALKSHFASEDLSKIVIWFDLFSNNQNQTEDIPFEWWCGTFQHSIHSIGRTVAVFLPWENPIPLSRVWCLWEIFISQKTKVKFEIAMSPTEESRFLDMISKDPDAFNVMLSNVDVEKSTSFKPSDRDQIFSVIQSTVGFRTVNQETIKCIKSSILTRLQSRVESQLLVSAISVDSELSALRSLCLTLKDIGNYDVSLSYCKKYVKTVVGLYGFSHPLTYDAYVILTDTCLACKHIQAAITILEPLMNHFYNSEDYHRGQTPFIILKTQHLLGKAFLEIEEEIELAYCILKVSYEKIRRIDGFDLRCMSIYADYAVASFKIHKNFILSAAVCDEALTLLVKGHGFQETHPYVMETMWKKAIFTVSLPDSETSPLNTLKMILNRMKIKYGVCHPATIECILAIHDILDPHEAYCLAYECYEATKMVYKPDSQLSNHPHKILAKFCIDFYYRNVRLYGAVMFVTICSYVGIVYYTDQLLLNQHDQTKVKPDIILAGFFTGFSYIYLLTPLGVKKEGNPLELLPLWLKKLSPLISIAFGCVTILSGILAFHFFLLHAVNVGYYFGGTFPGMFAGFLMMFILAVRSAVRTQNHAEKANHSIVAATNELKNRILENDIPIFDFHLINEHDERDDRLIVAKPPRVARRQLNFIEDYRKIAKEVKEREFAKAAKTLPKEDVDDEEESDETANEQKKQVDNLNV
jgi:hypothetical protein